MDFNIFISQPISDITNDKIRSRQNDILKKITNNPKCLKKCLERAIGKPHNYSPLDKKLKIKINPIKHEAPEGSGQIWRLGQAIADMEKADLVIFASGHRGDCDCRIERDVVEEYDIPFLYEAELDYCF